MSVSSDWGSLRVSIAKRNRESSLPTLLPESGTASSKSTDSSDASGYCSDLAWVSRTYFSQDTEQTLEKSGAPRSPALDRAHRVAPPPKQKVLSELPMQGACLALPALAAVEAWMLIVGPLEFPSLNTLGWRE